MNILPTKGKTSKYRKRIKLFGVSKKRRLKNSWKEKVIKEREIIEQDRSRIRQERLAAINRLALEKQQLDEEPKQ